MGKFKQVEKAMSVATPLGEDVLLLERFRGVEALSSLFRFELDLLAEADVTISFDKILGKDVIVAFPLEDGTKRYFNGIVQEFSQGEMVADGRGGNLIRYHAVVVPKLWRLTRNIRSRIFQQQSVPQILQTVLAGLNADTSAIQGTFQPRDFCAQYRESDFAFASRLMEDEGIWYCFEHSSSGHRLILGNSPQGHHDVPGPSRLTYQPISGGVLPDDRILTWEKSQSMRAHKVTLQDYCFEMADEPLQSNQSIQTSAQAGTVTHQLAADGSDQMEITDFPGTYAGRFDGVGPNGEDQSSQLQQISPDGDRTTAIRMQQEATPALRIRGDSSCRQLQAGCKFTLQKHFNGDGPYVLTRVEHEASVEGAFTDASKRDSPLQYHNRFEALPLALPFRPAQQTPRPRVCWVQTAVVVGPSGEQVNCDKYGRIKVQFRWDPRQGAAATGSCWIRVGQVWAGKGWGAFFWPRAGHEVVVAFEEGDIDQPLIVGSVYNSTNMPPLPVPDQAMSCGFKSCSMGGDPAQDFNAVIFHDQPGDEHLQMHSENHEMLTSESSKYTMTPGPHLQFSGSLLGLGSGAGGGVSEVRVGPDLDGEGSGSGGGLWSFVTDIASGIPNRPKILDWLASNVGAVNISYGDNLGTVLGGDRHAQILGGCDLRLVFDPVAMARNALAMRFFPTPIPALAGLALGAFLGLEGSTAVIGGPNTTLNYGGPVATVTHAPSYTSKGNDEIFPAVCALTALSVAAATASNIAARILATPKTGGGLSFPVWTKLAASTLTAHLLGALVGLEKTSAMLKAAANKVAATPPIVEQLAEDLLVPDNAALNEMAQLLPVVEDQVVDAAGDIANSLGMISAATADDHNDDFPGNYAVTAKSVALMTTQPDAPSSDTTLMAHNGMLLQYAEKLVTMFARDIRITASHREPGLMELSGGLFGDILLRAGDLLLGPELKLSGEPPSLSMQVGAFPAQSSIKLNPTGLTLQFGLWTLVLNAAGITLTVGVNKIEVMPGGINLSAGPGNGLTLMPTGLSVQTVNFETTANSLVETIAGTATRTATMQQIV